MRTALAAMQAKGPSKIKESDPTKGYCQTSCEAMPLFASRLDEKHPATEWITTGWYTPRLKTDMELKNDGDRR